MNKQHVFPMFAIRYNNHFKDVIVIIIRATNLLLYRHSTYKCYRNLINHQTNLKNADI